MHKSRTFYFVCFLQLLAFGNCLAQRANVTWVSAQSGQPLPASLLLGGRDNDLNADLYVCRVAINGGIHPGKLLNNYCNVSYGNQGTQYRQFEVAVISGGPGHWGPWNSADTADILLGGHEANGTPLYVCHMGYHNGVHPGKLVSAGACDFEWGGVEYSNGISSGQVFYLTPPPIVVNAPQIIKVFHVLVNANSSSWTKGVTLASSQSAVISVPRRPNGQPQKWGVIDPSNRGLTDITGNGVEARSTFVLPHGKEGSLLVRDAHGAPREFTNVDEKITFPGPGDISLIANDEGSCNAFPCHPLICFGCGPAKNGFTDNVGWMEVEITVTTP
jgi:hypothetical protein